MHEAGLMQSAISSACEAARQVGAIRILSIQLRVGTEAGVAVEALQFAYDALVSGTLADGAPLILDKIDDSDILELARVEVVLP